MKSIIISNENKGQRLDKMLFKYLKEAPSSFVYKMLRKKNIVLNGKKAQGTELLKENDEIILYLADDTLKKFMGENALGNIDNRYFEPDVVYEDANLLCVNKPAGILSQKSTPQDYSVNELLTDYLIKNGKLSSEMLSQFRPSVLNRLDRNTEGLILFGKTYSCANEISSLLRNRTIHKYYYCVVKGIVKDEIVLEGYLKKNNEKNTVSISQTPSMGDEASKIKTHIIPVKHGKDLSLLEVELITGKTHQIRAHLSSVGNPIIGDAKYGNEKINRLYRNKFGIDHQMLFSHKVIFPKMSDSLSQLSNKTIEIGIPKIYEDIINGHMEK